MPYSGSSLPLIFCIHVRSGPIYWGGVIDLAKHITRWWYFTCKKLENILCDCILHVNMFHYFKIPYFTCTFFTNFTYNKYIGPYHVVYDFPQWTPRGAMWYFNYVSVVTFVMMLLMNEFKKIVILIIVQMTFFIQKRLDVGYTKFYCANASYWNKAWYILRPTFLIEKCHGWLKFGWKPLNKCQ